MMRRLTIRFFFSLQKFDPKKDYYKVLLLSENATPEQIKTSFRNLAKKHHPDTKKGNEEMFKQINEANQILSSQDTKKEYDESRRANKAPTQQRNDYPKSNPRSYEKPYRQQQREYRRPQYEYDEQNPQKFREYLRKKHEEEMKKYTQQRQSYDNLGRGYQNYERFREETISKKKEKFEQKTKVTQQSVRKEEQIYRKFSAEKDRQYREKLMENLKKDIQFRYHRGIRNGEKTIKGLKEMGRVFKDFFKKK